MAAAPATGELIMQPKLTAKEGECPRDPDLDWRPAIGDWRLDCKASVDGRAFGSLALRTIFRAGRCCWPQIALATSVLFSTHATAFEEQFAQDPLTHGWRIFGDASLFVWSATNQNLQVTWDSSRPNSYLYRPLGTILNRRDDFSVAFDLRLDDVAAGVAPSKPSTFPLAVGFQNHADATWTNFFRGTGVDSPNLVEFSFFPDTGFGPTVWPAIWSTNSLLSYRSSSDFTILDLPVGVLMRITLKYTSIDAKLVTTITTNGVPVAPVNPVTLSPSFTDFRVDTFAVKCYSAQGPAPRFGGSLIAHGFVDNIVINVPPSPIQNLRGFFNEGQRQVTLISRPNWSYVLEWTHDFQLWNEVSPQANGSGGTITLQDKNNASLAARFYRVKAQRTD